VDRILPPPDRDYPEGLISHRYLTTKSLPWSEITRVSCLGLKSRAFLFLNTKKGFFIISNAYQDFGGLIASILDHLPDKVVAEEEVRHQLASPTRNLSDLITAWLAAIVLIAVIGFKLFVPS